jgi:hypothetical protein
MGRKYFGPIKTLENIEQFEDQKEGMSEESQIAYR